MTSSLRPCTEFLSLSGLEVRVFVTSHGRSLGIFAQAVPQLWHMCKFLTHEGTTQSIEKLQATQHI